MLAAESFAAKLVQANLSCKNDIAYFVHKTDFDGKLKNLNKKDTSNKTKHLLVKNELKKLQSLLLVKVTLIIMEHNFS